MSYDIEIVDPDTNEVLETPFKHNLVGGTFNVEGTNKLTFNVTYNYCKYYDFKHLNGKNVFDTKVNLALSLLMMGPTSDNYWEACPGNVRKAIFKLLELAQYAKPDSIWKVT